MFAVCDKARLKAFRDLRFSGLPKHSQSANIAGMDIPALRKEMKLSLRDFGALIGVSSISYMSEIESGAKRPTVAIALAVERVSSGKIDAAKLNPDVAAVRAQDAA